MADKALDEVAEVEVEETVLEALEVEEEIMCEMAEVEELHVERVEPRIDDTRREVYEVMKG